MMSLDEFKEQHERHGGHWFSVGAMKFFNSKITWWDNETGFFITSEVNPAAEKRYTVRQADFKTFNVKTIGEFHYHRSSQAAKKWLEGYKAGMSGDVEIQTTGDDDVQ